MGVRYKVLDLPPQGARAFTPIMAINPVASSYGLVQIYGSPGTQSVPVASPAEEGVPYISQDPKTQSSNVSPNVILPGVYYTNAKNMGPVADAGIGMRFRRLTPLPIPAIDALRSAQNTMRRIRVGGRNPTVWPRAFQRWYGAGAPIEGSG